MSTFVAYIFAFHFLALVNLIVALIVLQYMAQKIIMVHETPDLYKRIVVPYITSLSKSRTQWLVFSYYLHLKSIAKPYI